MTGVDLRELWPGCQVMILPESENYMGDTITASIIPRIQNVLQSKTSKYDYPLTGPILDN